MNLFKFNPGFLGDEDARATFIVRQDELQTLIQLFLGHGDHPPRALVTAPRGAGKTTLCRRVVAEARQSEPLALRWIPIFLGEESYTVTSPGEFFLECLFQLKDLHPESGLDQAYDNALLKEEETDLLEATLVTLRDFSERAQKRLLILVENFHVILHDQIGAERDTLLRLLRDDTLFGVMATSVAQSSLEVDRRAPKDYLALELRPLELPDCKLLWESLTQRAVREDRIRPLQILTGGSPRLLHVLADFMKTPSLRDLMSNLNRLIDENTEYFKSQLDALPPTERKVFVALLEIWDPSSAKAIATLARVQPNVSSAMLARLAERGAVMRIPAPGRTAYYYASERLFNIYYLMRRRSHPANRVRALVSFMIEYYDQDELIDTTTMIAHEACGIDPKQRADYHSTFDAILSRASEADKTRIIERAPPDFIRSFRADQRASRTTNLNKSSSFAVAMESVEAAFDGGDYDRALELLDTAILNNPDSSEPLARKAMLHRLRDEPTEAVDAAQKAVATGKSDPWAHAILGLTLHDVGNFSAAASALRKALKLNPTNPIALEALGTVRVHQGKNDEARALFDKALRTGNLSDSGYVHYAMVLRDAGLHEQAEATLRRAQREDPEAFESRRALVDLLNETERQSEAIDILRQSAKSFDKWRDWADLGSFLAVHTSEDIEAEAALSRAIELGGPRAHPVKFLSKVMESRGASTEEFSRLADKFIPAATTPRALTVAAEIYASARRLDDAENVFKRAIQSDQTNYSPVRFAHFLQDQGRSPEAEAVLISAIASASGDDLCGPSKVLAEIMVRDGRENEARPILDRALQANPNCYCCLVIKGEVCARQGDTERAKQQLKSAIEVNPQGVDALTALAKISSRSKGSELLERAARLTSSNPRVLLARAQLEITEHSARERMVRAAIGIEPTLVEGHLMLAELSADSMDHNEALAHLESALLHTASQRQFLSSFVDSSMYLAEAGLGPNIVELLANRTEGALMEPLSVAIRLKSGEEPMVAKEVMEVAADIIERFPTRRH